MNKDIPPFSIRCGSVMEAIVMHEAPPIGELSASRISARQINRDPKLRAFFEDCVARGNRLIGDMPLLEEALEGPFQLPDVIKELVCVLPHLDAYWYGREIFIDLLDEPDLEMY